jgi:hypothetical protein
MKESERCEDPEKCKEYTRFKSLLEIPSKYLSEKFLLQMLTYKYKIKYRTWKIMSDDKQIGIVTSASRAVKEKGKVTSILLQFSFLSPVDEVEKRVKIEDEWIDIIDGSRFEGHRSSCFNLFTQKPIRVIPNPEKPGAVKEAIKTNIILEIAKRKSFWFRKVWDPASTAIIEIV